MDLCSILDRIAEEKLGKAAAHRNRVEIQRRNCRLQLSIVGFLDRKRKRSNRGTCSGASKGDARLDDLTEPCNSIFRNTDSAGRVAQVEVVAINAFIAEPAAPQKESAVRSLQKTRLSISECDGILHNGEAALSSGSALEPGLDIVAVEQIQSAFGFRRPFGPNIRFIGTIWLTSRRRSMKPRFILTFTSRRSQNGIWNRHMGGVRRCAVRQQLPG